MAILIETSDVVAWPSEPTFEVLADYQVSAEVVQTFAMPNGTQDTAPTSSNPGTVIDLEIGYYTIDQIKAIQSFLSANRSKYLRLTDPRDQVLKLAKVRGPIPGEQRVGGVQFKQPLKLAFYEDLMP